MTYGRLVRANLFRRKRRTILTTLSVVAALFLLVTLRSVLTTLDEAIKVGSEGRMVTRNAISIVFFVPQAYYEKLRAVPGVKNVAWANWFGGVYRSPRDFFAQFAVHAETYFDVYPEIVVPENQMETFRDERAAAIVGRKLMERFGWTLGQTVTLRGTIFLSRRVALYDPRSLHGHEPRLPGRRDVLPLRGPLRAVQRVRPAELVRSRAGGPGARGQRGEDD
ncbi:MAG: ABC transporter permease [Gemmatimonadetes bacterium]|nr:ABC transporter permease [Gemmatimonadota bacterium]